MSNRKQPFGYGIEQGQTVTLPQEADTVQLVFEMYRSGASLKEIASLLNEQSVSYDEDKRWNKNMVARMLADERYTGAKDYPPIVEREIFNRIQEKRAAKQTVFPKTEAQNILRQLSGRTATPQVEQAVLALLNGLIRNPERIECPTRPVQYPTEVGALETALAAEMEKQPIDEAAAGRIINQVTAAQYAAIGPKEYETARLRRLFAAQEQLQELDAALLRTAVRIVQVTGHSTVRLQLKNGQEFGM